MNQAKKNLPWSNDSTVKVKIKSVSDYEMHINNNLELVLVLSGSININVGSDSHILQSDDIIFINANQLYTTRNTKEDNLLLFIEVASEFFDSSIIDLNSMPQSNPDFSQAAIDSEIKVAVRSLIAQIVFALYDQKPGYKFMVGSYLYQIGENFIKDIELQESDQVKNISESGVVRLQRIINFVNDNYNRSITLKEIAKSEDLNYFYLSHFIKSKLGVSFQEYLNTLRLNVAARLLTNTDQTVIEISNNNGFPSVSSLNSLFKEKFEMTPSEYRNNSRKQLNFDSNNNIDLSDHQLEKAISKLKTYLKKEKITSPTSQHLTSQIITVNNNDLGTPYTKHWQNLANFGCAKEALKVSWQRQLTMIQKDIGFDYFRFHGIFSKDMQTFSISQDHTITFNWTYVNEVLDTLLANNTKPYIELSFIPHKRSHVNRDIYWWEKNSTLKEHIRLWRVLTENFLNHVIKRYGIIEVNSWYLELWREPSADIENRMSNIDLFDFYKQSIDLIRSISKDVKIGGPSISYWTISNTPWFIEYLEYIKDKQLKIDFVSVYLFSEIKPELETVQNYDVGTRRIEIINNQKIAKRQYHVEPHLINSLTTLNDAKKNLINSDIQVSVASWNMTAWPDNYLSDTAFMATYIAKNIISTIGLTNSIGYWAFSDLTEVFNLGFSHFHGGLGLINKDGIRKASYNAYYLLSKLGDHIIEIGSNYIVTKKADNMQILVYNHAKINEKFKDDQEKTIDQYNRYAIFEEKTDKHIQIDINDINGKYKLSHYKLNREVGSAFDKWIKINHPENMSKDQVDYLKKRDKADKKVEYLNIDNNYSTCISIADHSIVLLTLEKY